MPDSRKKLTLPKRYLLIVLLPLAVYALLEWLLWFLGRTDVPVPEQFLFHPHEEAAARFRVLATFFLVISSAAASIGFFIYSLFRLDPQSRRSVLVAFAGVVGFVGVLLLSVVLATGQHRCGLVKTQEMVGQQLVVEALSRRDSSGRPGSARSAATWHARTSEEAAAASQALSCSPHHGRTDPPMSDFLLLRSLIDTESIFLAFAIPSLALGAILSLAWPAGNSPPGRHKALREEQIGRLTTFLYLSALMLVAGLLFLSAFLHWPLFALPVQLRAPYREHIHAVVLFHGVTYTVLLASYYLPVAGLLARRWRGLEPVDGKSDNMLDWRGFLKAALAVFAPLVVGLLGEVMKLPLAGG